MQEIYAKLNPQTTSYPLYEICHGIRMWMPFCDAGCRKVRQDTIALGEDHTQLAARASTA